VACTPAASADHSPHVSGGDKITKFKVATVIGSLVLGLAVSLVSPVAAQATTRATSTHAAITHSKIRPGTSADIHGYVSPNLHGKKAYLQRHYAGAWHTKASYVLSAGSGFRFKVGVPISGKYAYRVYFHAVAGWRASVSLTIYLTVMRKYTATLVTYSKTGDWQGPTIRIPTTDYTVAYQYDCVDTSSNFLSLSWNGQNFGYENLWSEPTNGTSSSGTWYGHSGARSGYFDIGTQASCTWSFSVKYAAYH
jgi:hypothetical protein